mgnify:CR=1 FL=1
MTKHNKKSPRRPKRPVINPVVVPVEVYEERMRQEPAGWPVEHLDTRAMAPMSHAGETFVPSGDAMGWAK